MRGRGGGQVVPGRGVRPLYTQLMQGTVQHIQGQPHPSPGNGRITAGFGNRDFSLAAKGSDGGGTRVLESKQPNAPSPGVCAPSEASGLSSAPRPEHDLVASSISVPSIAVQTTTNSVPTPMMKRRVATVEAQSMEQRLEPRRPIAATFRTLADPSAGSAATSSSVLQNANRLVLPTSLDYDSDRGPHKGGARPTVMATSELRGGVEKRAAKALTPGSPGTQLMAVKDTTSITRKKAQLPQQEQLQHPVPVGGSWLKNRYIVNNFILLELLGTGSYAEVRLAKEKNSEKLYAVKIMNKDFLKKRQVGKGQTFMDSIEREITIMKKVYHPNVLRLYEVMDDPKVNKLYLVLEYCEKGDLMNILHGDARALTCDPMNDMDVWYITRQIVRGLNFLHLQNIVHGDIKPQNLLVR
ncbi:unnamed protein product [Ascophyllum nodosum]